MSHRKLLHRAIVLALATACLSAKTPLTIAIMDYAHLPDEVLLSAVHVARQAFNEAGLDTAWTICHYSGESLTGCTRPLPADGRYVSMLVMPSMLLRPPANASTALSGQTDPGGFALTGAEARLQPRAWAFYGVAESAAAKARRPPATVLGFIIVHEIGHTLGLSHKARGIMQPNLDPSTLDESTLPRAFTLDEARTLRSAAAATTGER